MAGWGAGAGRGERSGAGCTLSVALVRTRHLVQSVKEKYRSLSVSRPRFRGRESPSHPATPYPYRVGQAIPRHTSGSRQRIRIHPPAEIRLHRVQAGRVRRPQGHPALRTAHGGRDRRRRRQPAAQRQGAPAHAGDRGQRRAARCVARPARVHASERASPQESAQARVRDHALWAARLHQSRHRPLLSLRQGSAGDDRRSGEGGEDDHPPTGGAGGCHQPSGLPPLHPSG